MNDCSCATCVGACSRKPGWFNPGQVEKVAEFLGISLEELFKTKLAVDFWASVENPIFLLSPAVVGNQPGTEFPIRAIGKCVFLTEDDKCSIHPVKPYECREFRHGDSREKSDTVRNTIVENWSKERQQIVNLLGREPEMPMPTLLDALQMIEDSGVPLDGFPNIQKMKDILQSEP